jgi:aminoglycoside 2''-phosphotransferase
MEDEIAIWQDRIHEVLPDLEIFKLNHRSEGLVNDVLIVNDAWVVRFTTTAWGEELMRQEHRLIGLIQPHLTMTVPSSRLVNNNVIIYPYIQGITFSRQIWAKRPESDQRVLADQLGLFLRELHGIPIQHPDWDIPHTLAPVSRETWLDIYDNIETRIKPLLLPHQMDWMEALFEEAMGTPDFFEFDPAVVHGDLVPYHIVYHPTENQIAAIIDYGSAGIGDPATDLASLIYNYGERLVSKLAETYPGYGDIIERARFYAHALDLQWVLLGIESGENYWFTAHLGGARDIFD